MPDIGLAEAFVIFIVLFFIFGPNRVADIGGGLGRAVRGFRKELGGDDSDSAGSASSATQQQAFEGVSRCSACSGQLRAADKFCMSCGAPVSVSQSAATPPA